MTEQPAGNRLFLVRLTIGLTQGLLLYLLYHAQEAKVWPGTDGLIYSPLLLVGLFIPLLLIQALGEMPWRKVLSWTLLATIILALLGIYDVWSDWPRLATGAPHLFPASRLYAICVAGLFIAHALVVGATIDRRFQATYATHFDIAWKLAIQVVLTSAFVGIFWLFLRLGAGLFSLIKLEFFAHLLSHEWFFIPVSALATASALHLTDVRPALVRGARTLLLGLMSWLLPLLTLIVTGFLLSLPFTGLQPLWAVGHASALLLVAAASLILLINAAYQDGDPNRAPPQLLRWSGSIAAVLPLPLGALAIYALLLRVNQYGWSQDRVLMAAALLVAGGHALGYARAAFVPGRWLASIESGNFIVSLFGLAMMLALSSPLADPRRIAVADQIHRLNTGKIKPAAFDFRYLHLSGGRYGYDALLALTRTAGVQIRRDARLALNDPDGNTGWFGASKLPGQQAAHFTVYPAGAKIPASLYAQSWGLGTFPPPPCLEGGVGRNFHCNAFVMDVSGDDVPEILIQGDGMDAAQILQAQSHDKWHHIGQIRLPAHCPAMDAALRAGRINLVAPVRTWRDIQAGGVTLQFEPDNRPVPDCPKPD